MANKKPNKLDIALDKCIEELVYCGAKSIVVCCSDNKTVSKRQFGRVTEVGGLIRFMTLANEYEIIRDIHQIDIHKNKQLELKQEASDGK